MPPLPTDPALAALAASLTPEAYHALEPILTTLASRIEAQKSSFENFILHLQNSMRNALAGANFTIQTPSNPGGRPANLRIDLPIFRGTRGENI